MLACCCGPTACPCVASLSSVAVTWSGWVELEAMSCADYFSTPGFGCALTENFSVRQRTRISIPQDVIVRIGQNSPFGSCGGQTVIRKRIPMDRRFISFIPSIGSLCPYDTLDTIYHPFYTIEFDVTVNVLTPFVQTVSGSFPPSRDYWVVQIDIAGNYYRWHSEGGFTCNPTMWTWQSHVMNNYCLPPGTNTAVVESPPQGYSWPSAPGTPPPGEPGAPTRNWLVANMIGTMKLR